MTAISSQINPLIKNGKTIYYNEEGYRTSVGYHENNKPVGHWVWYYKNEGDSSVADYRADGTKNYTRICSCEPQDKDKGIYTIVEEMPEFPGGVKEMQLFIQKTITYPASCREKSIGGKVFLKFVVSPEGKISEANVIKSSGSEVLDAEALRVINSMPLWKPGYMNGKPVFVYFNIPLNFSLDYPFFVFNATNKNENYLQGKKLIEEGNWKQASAFFEKADLTSDPDALYNLGVIAFQNKDKEKFCRCFKAVTESSSEGTLGQISNNSQKYIQKYCN